MTQGQASVFYDEHDYHSIEVEESISYADDYVINNRTHRRSRDKDRSRTRLAHVYMADSTTSSAKWRTINVSRDA